MPTHIEKQPPGTKDFDFFETRGTTARRLTICGVICDGDHIVEKDPSCSWCLRKIMEDEENSRLGRIAKARLFP